MQTAEQHMHVVTLSKDDVAKLLGEHMKDLTPADAVIGHGQQQGRFFAVTFPVSREQMDAVLRPMIADLPKLGEYIGPRLQPDGSAIIRWPDPAVADAAPTKGKKT